MRPRRPLAALTVASGLLVAAGCPDKPAATPPRAPAPSTPAHTDTKQAATPTPLPPAERSKEGWGAVARGSSFESVTKTHVENGSLPDTERTTVETVTGEDTDGVHVHVVSTSAGAKISERDDTYSWKSLAKDPEAKPLPTTHETVTAGGKSYECDVTTEVEGDATKKTWRAKGVPVPVKVEIRGGGVTSTSELMKAELK